MANDDPTLSAESARPAHDVYCPCSCAAGGVNCLSTPPLLPRISSPAWSTTPPATMSFGPTFGSFGDFVTLVSLVKELIQVLDDCRGSSKDYRDVVSTLRIQLVALNRVGELYGAAPRDGRETAIQSNVHQVLQQIRQCIDEFLNKLSGFAPSLANSGSRKRPFDLIRKIEWRIERKEIDVFEKRVAAYNDVLHMYVGLKIRYSKRIHHSTLRSTTEKLAISDTLESTRDRLSTQLSQHADASEEAHAAQSKSLNEIQACILVVGRAMLAKLGELAEACDDIRSSVALVIHSGLLLLPLLQAILIRLTQLTPSLEDTYFVLADHLGGRKKIYLGNILSWDMFYDLLALSYKSERGARRIGKRRFALEQNKTNQEIDTRTPWKGAFRPCQVVQLSLLCRRTGSAEKTSQCPGCGYACTEAESSSTAW